MAKFKISKTVRRIMVGLPLACVVFSDLLFPISTRAHQFLVGVTLVWFQVFILSEVFSTGNNV